MHRDQVSNAVIRRMPKYYRCLNELAKDGVTRISSRALAEYMGLTASQIRQDFNCFGGFGQQGYGYNVDTLMSEIANILGVEKLHKAVMIGVGNIGHALLHNFNFAKCGFEIVCAFDLGEDVIGNKVEGVPVLHPDDLEKFAEENPFDIAILTLPKKAAPEMSDRLVNLGIKGIWNFVNVDLKRRHPDIVIEDVHFADSLMTLCYQITE